jgi:hypothetical protein
VVHAIEALRTSQFAHGTIFGRESELDAARDFLNDPVRNRGFFVVRGATGIGKTALFSAIVADAAERGFSVLTCRPAEPERSLAFAALSDLLAAIPQDYLSPLPVPQRHALPYKWP